MGAKGFGQQESVLGRGAVNWNIKPFFGFSGMFSNYNGIWFRLALKGYLVIV